MPDPDRIRFELPAEDARSGHALARQPRLLKPGERPRVLIGAPVWTCPDWVGKVYPPRTPAKDFLKHYSRRFNSIELNSTFYALPDVKTIHGWAETTPEEFRFSPKLPQDLSRAHDLGKGTDLILRTARAFGEFGSRLGTSFMQLPPGFAPHQLPVLAEFLRAWPRELPISIEFRHPGWFMKGALDARAFDLLAARGAGAVITDTSGRRDVLHASLTSRRVVIRFVGNELHPSDFTRIDSWVERLGPWLAEGVEELSFFMHHETFVNVPELRDDFASKMNRRWAMSLPVGAPESVGGQQLSLI